MPTLSGRVDLKGIFRAAAWITVGAAAVRLVDGFLGSIPAVAPMLGALMVDLLAGRAGVRWSQEETPPWWRDIRRGGAIGASAALAVVVLGVLAGWANARLGTPGLTVAFALVRVFGEATRDVMLLVGLPVTLGLRAGVPRWALVAFSAAAASAPLLLAEHADVPAVASAAAMFALAARLVIASRGVTAGAAAYAAWLLLLGPLTRGGMLDVAWRVGDPGPPPHAEGVIAWISAAMLVALAAIGVPRFASATPAGATPAPSPPAASSAGEAPTPARRKKKRQG